MAPRQWTCLALELPSSKRRRGSRTRDQPPTRTARRDGFGMPLHQVRGNKKPAAQGVAGSLKRCRLRFREGNETRVHRLVDPGGGSCCLARCRFVVTHSLPQGGCLRRNLITVFFFVNNPLRFFISLSGVQAGSGRATNGRARCRADAIDRTRACLTVAKNILFYAFDENRAALRAPSRASSQRCASRVSEGATRVARRPENIFRNDASQHPIRGELRKLSTPFGNESGRARRPDRDAATCAAMYFEDRRRSSRRPISGLRLRAVRRSRRGRAVH